MKNKFVISIFLSSIIVFSACGSSNKETEATHSLIVGTSVNTLETSPIILDEESVPSTVASSNGQRDNTIVCLTPVASGTTVYTNSVASIDVSNISEGYTGVSYFGTCPKVKLQITRDGGTTYTYNLTSTKGYEFFPLSEGSGSYSIVVYENVYDNQYAVALSQTVSVIISNSFGPNLYPNQYVNFNATNNTVQKAAELAKACTTDLDVVTSVYNYVVSHITYDYEKAATVQSGYTCNIDETLASGTGICLDYASVMCAMLRSQRIPARLEVGYAGTAYHAWISTYIDDIGWVNGMIEFDGVNWKIMDPTFASTTDPETLKNFLDDSSNYQTKYIY